MAHAVATPELNFHCTRNRALVRHWHILRKCPPFAGTFQEVGHGQSAKNQQGNKEAIRVDAEGKEGRKTGQENRFGQYPDCCSLILPPGLVGGRATGPAIAFET
jgi:hypothetical protein